MNKAGGRVKAQEPIKSKWFRQTPKNWQRRCARIFANAKLKAARRSQLMALMKKAISPRNRTPENSLTKVHRNKIPHVERVVSRNVLPSGITEGNPMFGMIAAVLVVLWLLGFLAFHVAGGLIHLLLVVAVIMLVIHFVSGRRAV
jgi:Flp pilus assembly protein TadB